MALIPVKCIYCGGDLQVVNMYQPIVCPYCHSTFVIQPDVNNCNNTININNDTTQYLFNIAKLFKSY